MSTKPCPGCNASLTPFAVLCDCGYDFTQEPCPGCDVRIDMDLDVCPHCSYNLLVPIKPKKEKPAKEPKPPKEPKAPKERTATAAATATATATVAKRRPSGRGGYAIHVPALGRMGQPAIDFPELHLRLNCAPAEVSDDQLYEWGMTLKEVWQKRVHDQGYLTNHAVGYLASTADEKVLRDNVKRIVELIGGDDYN